MFIFITGWYPNLDSVDNPDPRKGLHAAIRNFWLPRLGLRSMMTVRFDEDVVGRINREARPDEPLVVAGFSFGGAAAITAAMALQPRSLRVLLLDPVPNGRDGFPVPFKGFPGFDLPDNIKAAHCFYRQANASPWSAPIRTAACSFTNIKYNPVSQNSDAAHGEYVWRNEAVGVVKSFLL